MRTKTLLFVSVILATVFSACKKDEFKNLELSFTKSGVQVEVGGVENLKELLVINPQSLDTVTVQWSVEDPAIAEVKDGSIKGLKKGKTIVTAASHGKSASISVDVTEIRIKSITLPSSYPNAKVNAPFALSGIEIDPSGVSPKRLVWSCESDKVTFEYNEEDHLWYVTATESGDYTLQVSADDVESQSVVLTVKRETKVIKEIRLSDTELTLYSVGTEKRSAPLTYTIYPEDAVYKDVLVSYEGVMTCARYSDGKVTSRDEGEGVVTIIFQHRQADEDDVTVEARCKVTVVKSPIEEYQVQLSSSTVTYGGSVNASITSVKPSGAPTGDITWSVSDRSLVTLSTTKGSSCVITSKAKQSGKVTITATAPNGYKQTAELTLAFTPVTSIKFADGVDKQDLLGYAGNSYYIFNAEVTPSTATLNKVVYTSSPSGLTITEQSTRIKIDIPAVSTLTKYKVTATVEGDDSKSTYFYLYAVPNGYLNTIKVNDQTRFEYFGKRDIIEAKDLHTGTLPSKFIKMIYVSRQSAGARAAVVPYETYKELKEYKAYEFDYNKMTARDQMCHDILNLQLLISDMNGLKTTSDVIKWDLYSSLQCYAYVSTADIGNRYVVNEAGTINVPAGENVSLYVGYYTNTSMGASEYERVKLVEGRSKGSTYVVTHYGSDVTKAVTGDVRFTIKWK